MRMMKLVLAAVAVGGVLFASGTEARAQNKSQSLTISGPSSARRNTDVTFTVTLSDAWNGSRLPGRIVGMGVGQEFFLTNSGGFNTNNQGIATFRWRFTNTGRYRVVAFADNGFGYLSQRTTFFININP